MHRDEILDGEKLLSSTVLIPLASEQKQARQVATQEVLSVSISSTRVSFVKFTPSPRIRSDELEKLVADAESVLKLLKLHYRVAKICIGDLGFTAAMKSDIEVWMPSYNRLLRFHPAVTSKTSRLRANIKYKNSPKDKAQFVHTLNGSGVAIGRTTAAIL